MALRQPCRILLALLLVSSVALAAPSITLSRKLGPPTSSILVSGRGFAPFSLVNIHFDTSDAALVIANKAGEFRHALIHVPKEAKPGKHWVTALGRNLDNAAQEPFVVNTNWGQFHFEANAARCNPYENVLDPATAGDLAQVWSYAVGSMYSSPTVADGIVYIGSDDFSLYALDAATGVLKWSYATGNEVSSTPGVAAGVVFRFVGQQCLRIERANRREDLDLWNRRLRRVVTGGRGWRGFRRLRRWQRLRVERFKRY